MGTIDLGDGIDNCILYRANKIDIIPLDKELWKTDNYEKRRFSMPNYKYSHEHLMSPDPQKTADFYIKMFGAKTDQFENWPFSFDSLLKYGCMDGAVARYPFPVRNSTICSRKASLNFSPYQRV
jgi:hypothetical protein